MLALTVPQVGLAPLERAIFGHKAIHDRVQVLHGPGGHRRELTRRPQPLPRVPQSGQVEDRLSVLPPLGAPVETGSEGPVVICVKNSSTNL